MSGDSIVLFEFIIVIDSIKRCMITVLGDTIQVTNIPLSQ